MKKKILYWIDDSNEPNAPVPKGAVLRQIESQLGIGLQVPLINTHEDFADVIDKMNERQTWGVLMDYHLSKVGHDKKVEYGTTWAAQLRALKPSIPIVGLSFNKENQIPKFRMENFIAFFDRKLLLSAKLPDLELKALFDGYHVVWQSWKQKKDESGTTSFCELLKTPALVADLLKMAIPEQFRSCWDDETPHAACRWIWHQFQGVPGFLFDELELATHLGLTQEAFHGLTSHFDAARYKGVMACESRPRWWIALIRGVVEKIVKKPMVGPVAQSRDLLLSALKVSKNQHSKMFSVPHGRKGSSDVPDCVAYRSPEWDAALRVPAMLEDTLVPDPDSNPPFGFQPRRHYQKKNDDL